MIFMFVALLFASDVNRCDQYARDTGYQGGTQIGESCRLWDVVPMTKVRGRVLTLPSRKMGAQTHSYPIED